MVQSMAQRDRIEQEKVRTKEWRCARCGWFLCEYDPTCTDYFLAHKCPNGKCKSDNTLDRRKVA